MANPKLRTSAIIGQAFVYVVASDTITSVASRARATVKRAGRVETLNANIARRCETLVYISLANTVSVFLPAFSEFQKAQFSLTKIF